jgi:hypothetical protein
MKKSLISLLIIFLMTPVVSVADSFSTLWKQVSEAQNKDLPQTELTVLKKITDRAAAEKAYGQLMKAELMSISVQTQVSPDSLAPAVARLAAKEQQVEKSKEVLASVYASVLGKIYMDNASLDEDHAKIGKEYYRKSLRNPSLLASQTSLGYVPLVVEGIDSRIFMDDLLHVLGIEAGEYKLLHDFYLKKGNHAAACICEALMVTQQQQTEGEDVRRSKYLQRIDSLINVYKDLPEAGELAIARYHFMEQANDVTTEDKMNYINYALSRWGAWTRMNVLRNAQSRLTLPNFHVSIGEGVSVPNTERKVLIMSITNVQVLTMTVQRLNVDGDTQLNPSVDEDYAKLKKLLVGEQQTETRHYFGLPDYKETRDSMTIAPLPVGVYLVEFSTDNSMINPERMLLRVSDMYALRETLPDKSVRLAAVSARTGQPIPGAKIRLTTSGYYDQKDKVETLTCDDKGETVYKYENREPDRMFVYTDADKACQETDFNGFFNYYDRANDVDQISLFTDRRVYRPGQTVHVAAVLYRNRQHTQDDAIGGRPVTLTLRDANYKVVSEQQVKTDDYGTASADFVLPSSGLTGQFSIRTSPTMGNVWFSVEEYKRPTFQVEFEKVQTKYAAGDTVRVKGSAKSFAGVPVQGAKVKYTVTRRPALWWWSRSYRDIDKVMSTDTLVTDDKGNFVVPVVMDMPEKDNGQLRARYYNFNVEAQVTDVSGESRSGEANIPLSDKPTAFSCDLPEKVEGDSLKLITFIYKNNAGQDIDGDVAFQIDNDKLSCKANVAKNIERLHLKSGGHQLVAICGNDTIKQNFVTFSMEDKSPVVKTHDWFYQTSEMFPRDGKPVYVQVGSSDADQHIVYTIISGNSILESGCLDQSNAIVTREFKYQEKYGNGLLLTYAWVKDGKLYEHHAEIRRQLPDDRLNMKWTTFRDRLTPGQKEEWILNITHVDGKAADAQLMATLYDKSLDLIRDHQWSFYSNRYLNLPGTRWDGCNFGDVSAYGEMPIKLQNERILDFDHFDENIFPSSGSDEMMVTRVGGVRNRMPMANTMLMAKATTVVVAGTAKQRPMTITGAVAGVENNETTTSDHAGTKTDASDQLRENLNETAFFYPALQSDTKGNVKISFTLPESITTWRFMGFAHTKDMNYSILNGEAVAQKTVMIQPNMPRFVRMGDQVQISARIFNTSEKDVNGNARLDIIDPETEKVILSREQKYVVKAHETGSAAFDFTTDKLPSVVIVRMTATGKGYSDGEQHYLPVLPNQELVTNTVPITQHGPGTVTVDLHRLFPQNTTNQKLTVEYTNQPAWLMIQSLPTISNVDEKNAVSLAAAYYARSLASYFLTSYPHVKQTIEKWRQESTKETSLQSTLQKNEELKSLLLNETPWVMDAENETEQKQMLVNYFDENALNYQQSQTLSQLKKLQNVDGSFSWWPGMPGSVYMTAAVTEMMTRLNVMTGKNADVQMMNSSFNYLGKQLLEEANELRLEEKKGAKNLRPSESAVHILYIATLADNDFKANAKKHEAYLYLLKLLGQEPTQLTIYGKALCAVIFANHSNYATVAKQYLQSIKEYTVMKPELGRYFDTPKAYQSWFDYRIPTEVAALEALQRITPEDIQTIEEMQRWLLQEKRTHAWGTPINNVNAVYAFFQNNTKLLQTQDVAKLSVDGKALELPKATAGLGYVKTSMTGNNLKTFTADKTSDGTSWGAVYAQFMQTSTEVTDAASGLSVKREVLNASKPLKVGDKVKVRLTIVADRDYDFVQLMDKRAACLEPVGQLSGYHWGYYCAPKDNTTNYYFDLLSKGKHVIETEYYVDRAGNYQTGTCLIQCAYSPEFAGRAAAIPLTVTK